MTSYLSSLLTNTTSGYQSLRRSLLNSDDTDGDTEDDSHICRALRSYYVEKGRPFPGWLPADPREAKRAAAAHVAQGQLYARGGYANAYQRSQPSFQSSMPAGARRGGGLGDLWDSPNGAAQPQQPPSLRRGPSSTSPMGRTNFHGAAVIAGQDPQGRLSSRPGPSREASSHSLRQRPAAQTGDDGASLAHSASASGYGMGGAPTAQDRLKQKLWGKGRGGGM